MSGREKKKRKKLKVEMEFLEAEDGMSPIIGYFPSGYDPVGTGADPEVKLFRNKRRNKRFELVVHPSESNVEFVGKNYVGEAAALQPCTQALGVLDKETQTLKIIPIAFNKDLTTGKMIGSCRMVNGLYMLKSSPLPPPPALHSNSA